MIIFKISKNLTKETKLSKVIWINLKTICIPKNFKTEKIINMIIKLLKKKIILIKSMIAQAKTCKEIN
jgi:hypothetical protein